MAIGLWIASLLHLGRTQAALRLHWPRLGSAATVPYYAALQAGYSTAYYHPIRKEQAYGLTLNNLVGTAGLGDGKRAGI